MRNCDASIQGIMWSEHWHVWLGMGGSEWTEAFPFQGDKGISMLWLLPFCELLADTGQFANLRFTIRKYWRPAVGPPPDIDSNVHEHQIDQNC